MNINHNQKPQAKLVLQVEFELFVQIHSLSQGTIKSIHRIIIHSILQSYTNVIFAEQNIAPKNIILKYLKIIRYDHWRTKRN